MAYLAFRGKNGSGGGDGQVEAKFYTGVTSMAALILRFAALVF